MVLLVQDYQPGGSGCPGFGFDFYFRLSRHDKVERKVPGGDGPFRVGLVYLPIFYLVLPTHQTLVQHLIRFCGHFPCLPRIVSIGLNSGKRN